MAGSYATIGQARDYGYQSQDADETILIDIIKRASRLFDRYCGLPDGYFDRVPASTSATTRYFWGDGTDFLKVDPYLTATTPTVTLPTGFSTITWIEANPLSTTKARHTNAAEFFLIRTYGDNASRLTALSERRDYFFAEFSNDMDYIGWPAGIRVSISAKWGWAAIPDDVREAVLETTIAIWRNKDQAFARAVAIDGNILINDVMPPRARMIADRYRVGKVSFA